MHGDFLLSDFTAYYIYVMCRLRWPYTYTGKWFFKVCRNGPVTQRRSIRRALQATYALLIWQHSCQQAWLDEYLFITHRRMGYTAKFVLFFLILLSRLVTIPLTVATEKFKKDAVSEGHRHAFLMADNFLRVMKSKQKSIGEQLSIAMAARIDSNRQKSLSK